MGYFSKLADPGTSQHLAEQCKDEACHRLPCRMFKAGYRKGYDDGYSAGFAAGYSAGYSAGFSAGLAAGTGSG